MGMKWLITGGCGFLGTSLVRRLVSEGGHEIRIVDNLSVGTREDLAAACEFSELPAAALLAPISPFAGKIEGDVRLIVGDILDDKLAMAAARGVHVIVHLAANTGVAPSVDDPRMDCMTNVIGTLNYLEAARKAKVRRFVFASSGAPVGEVEPPIHEEIVPHPVSPYGASKLAGEAYGSAYFRTYGLETVALRFGNVYGPGSGHKNSVIARFIKRALHGEPLEIYGDGYQTRDFIYIDDLLSALCAGAQVSGIGGEVFQIATSTETSVREMVEELARVFSERGIVLPAVQYGEARVGDVRRNFSDTGKADRMLGWRAHVELDKGLGQTVDWFRSKAALA
jgi:UDP-glucose 4-epimerase